MVSWAPFEAISHTILDVSAAAKRPESTLHVIHPHRVSWRSIMVQISSALFECGIMASPLPILSASEWHAKLLATRESTDESSISRVPAIKLAALFEFMARADQNARIAGDPATEAGGLTVLATEKAQTASHYLRTLPHLGEDDVRRWINYWAQQRFFS
jgi:hypothetical protein